MYADDKIMFIAPYNDLAALATEVIQENNFGIKLNIALMEDAIDIAKQAEKDGFEAIISRGGTSELLKNKCRLTIVEIFENQFEILYAIQEGMNYGKKLALVWYDEALYADGFIFKSLQVDIKLYKYNTKSELEKQVAKAVQDGAEVIISGAYGVEFSKRLGKTGVIVGCNKDTILNSIKQAQKIVSVKLDEKVKRKNTETIIKNVHDGIIAIDYDGIITTFNPAVEKMLNIDAKNAIGQNYLSIIPNIPFSEVLENEDQYNFLLDIGTSTVSVNEIKLELNGKLIGAVATFQDATIIQNIEEQIRKKLYLKGQVARYNFHDIIGSSKALNMIKNTASKYAKSEQTILLYGETGCGKEMFAQSIHNNSMRRNGPFVAINCAELSDELFKSELFGYEEGAFTGAKKGGKQGLFQVAHKGTIFLDEIGELPISLQTSLLRVIQEKTIRPIGSDKIIPIDVRLIVATNKNLSKMVVEQKFRQDLYYRLNVLNINIPPLRERREDIPLIIKEISKATGTALNIDDESMDIFMNYNWPGNIRELQNFINRLTIVYGNNRINKNYVFTAIPEILSLNISTDNECTTLDTITANVIKETLSKTHGNQSEAARILGVSRTFIWRKLNETSRE